MKKIWKSNITGEILFLLGVILLWQILYMIGVDGFGIWKSYAMPSPSGVWNSFTEMIKQGTLLSAIGNSLLRGAIGYILSLMIGGVIGVFMNHFSFLHKNLRPLIMGIQTLPSICWVPFSILWFGLTQTAIIFVVIMGSAFSMAIAVDNAILNVPPIYTRLVICMARINEWRSNDDIHRTWPDINDREKSCRYQSGYARHGSYCGSWNRDRSGDLS